MQDNNKEHFEDPQFSGYWAHPRLRSALVQMQHEMDALRATPEQPAEVEIEEVDLEKASVV